ncbi:DUF6907 domain-containing protein [Mycobacterium sp. IDR2000157661]|uniref:DUF6907 domain-containing protein n=1 Tax=Mycobacterium sp. IDR2000157661 TaxID=2867005 RepID=UPI001EEAEB4A|nr:hypothetical protein [Mycobacterium sp. IDR2000157661]ULE32870.1 hypothetical protein K3G64_22825 [Mycobacterium sp. IDR2000157661]
MTTTLRLVPNPVSPVVCTPWCDRGDGHPDEWCREDQSCWGPVDYIELELEPVEVEAAGRFPSRLGVMPHRQHDGAPLDCYLHVELPGRDVDTSARLTATEARKLAQALVTAADVIEGTS